jgi:peptide-methionine (S)-S-oxide reductase
MSAKPMAMPTAEQALPGRSEPIAVSSHHYVNRHSIKGPFPENLQQAVFGLGCFWGAERCFWQQHGVYSTAVGYAAGFTPNPGYEEVCSGMTGHNEVVLVIYDPAIISYQQLLTVFWESHNPTQGMQQGNDKGTQYRSGIYYFNNGQQQLAEASKEQYSSLLRDADWGAISTEILAVTEFYYAEDHHQQYLAKNPGGYCGLGGTGVSCPALTVQLGY